LKGIAITG